MLTKFYLIISLSLLTCTGWSVNSSVIPIDPQKKCTGSKVASNDPIAVLQWLKNTANKNKSIEQVICCMPDKFKKFYKISHSSLSAQESHHSSPRLLFGDINADGIIFSVSGGDPNLSQSNSIEIMFNNPQLDELELFDIEFKDNGRRHVSKRNPQVCISCHGTGGVVGKGGIRPIFNPSPWPRMVTAPSSPCHNQQIFFKESEKKVFSAIKNNPRFGCLNRPNENESSFIPDNNSVSFNFDDSLESMNHRRVAKEIKHSPDFHKIRPFLTGVALGCFSVIPSQRSNIETITNNWPELDTWFPKKRLSDFNQTLYLPKHLKKETSRTDFETQVKRASVAARNQMKKEEEIFANLTQSIKEGKNPKMPPGIGFVCSDGTLEPGVFRMAEKVSHLIKNPTAKKYVQSTIYKTFREGAATLGNNSQTNHHLWNTAVKEGLLQWVFRSRGIDTRDWDMALILEDSRRLLPSVTTIPEIQKILSTDRSDMPQNNGTFHPPNVLKQKCEKMRQESLRVNQSIEEEEIPESSNTDH